MDLKTIEQILQDWNFWVNELPTGVVRSAYINNLKKITKSNYICVLTGIRRSGKSFIMRQLAKHLINNGTPKENTLFVNFEDPRFTELTTDMLQNIYDYYLRVKQPKGVIYFFLDEIQKVEKWEKWVRMMHELNKAKIIISGSNAHLLSPELGTVLTGRHLDLVVFPLSFQEFLQFYSFSRINKTQVMRKIDNDLLLRDYLTIGGFPSVVMEKEKNRILLEYFNDLVLRDLLQRYHIRKSPQLLNLIKYYYSAIAAPITFNSAARFLQLSPATVEKFSSYLEATYLVFFLKRFSYSVKEREKSPRKIYGIDTGLANTLGMRFSDNWGRLAENAVYLELLRRSHAKVQGEIFYWHNQRHGEVDFVIKEGLKVVDLIQVCWDARNIRTYEREVHSLRAAMKELKLARGTMIVAQGSEERYVKEDGIDILFLGEWLINPNRPL